VNDSRLVVRTIAFLVLLFLFVAAGMNLQRMTLAFGRSQPENYAALAKEAIRQRDYDAALRQVERRLAKRFYDFDALYLKAEILALKGNYAEAAATIRDVLLRVPGARANQVQAIGFDEPKTYYLFALYSWKAGQYEQAAELLRAALDAGYPVGGESLAEYMPEAAKDPEQALAVAHIALRTRQPKAFLRAVDQLHRERRYWLRGELALAEWMETIDKNKVGAAMRLRAALSLYPKDPAANLALANFQARNAPRSSQEVQRWRQRAHETTGVKVIGPGLFTFTSGNYADKRGLIMGRNGKATASISTGAFKVTRLIINARGTWALGMYPILVVRVDDRDVAWLYLDGLQPHLFDLELWPNGAPKDLKIEFEFINDAYEPTSKADRNVVIEDILLY